MSFLNKTPVEKKVVVATPMDFAEARAYACKSLQVFATERDVRLATVHYAIQRGDIDYTFIAKNTRRLVVETNKTINFVFQKRFKKTDKRFL